MNKVVIGLGGVLAVLAVAAFASAEQDAAPKASKASKPSGARRGSRRPTEEEEEEYGVRWSEECNQYDTDIQVLEGQRDGIKGNLVDIDADLMAAYQNGDEEAAAQLEVARKGTQDVLANINAQISGLDAKIDAECMNGDRA